MKRVNIQDAKTHLSRYAKRVKAGETIILCERNVPFAEIRPLESLPKKVRLGLFQGQVEIRDDFNDSLEGFESAFYGEETPEQK
ncbi:hypothetical protein N9B94_01745 [Verrucomicrobia bacterium]|nr:hypothetical protein [Verrucomicrobiota bacterium]